MNEAKEFLGKNLDAAIAEACKYFDSNRDQLEIEIIEDAKSGIFGLVGARKAKIMAKRVEIPDLLRQSKGEKPKKENKPESKPEPKPESRPESRPDPKAEPRGRQTPRPGPEGAVDGEAPVKAEAQAAPAAREDRPPREDKRPEPASKGQTNKGRKKEGDGKQAAPAPRGQKGQPDERPEHKAEQKGEDKKNPRAANAKGKKPQPQNFDRTAGQQEGSDEGQDNDGQDSGFPKVPLADLDQARLERTCREIILRLVGPITDDVEVKVNIGHDRVQLRLESEDSGLLIGREGQNLAAIQYLATRMISRAMDAQIKIQIDAGDYHTRQDVRLQEMAQNLAQKVRTSGRSMSTKPLSAYQRRVIHLALQDDPDVQTRSSGEGSLKRVVVMRRKVVE